MQVSGGGTRLPLREIEPGTFGLAMRLAGRLGQTGLTNLIHIASYDYGTMTCANPGQVQGYGP